eukprot:jgi/Mesvir1/23697/Mv18649-RA.1
MLRGGVLLRGTFLSEVSTAVIPANWTAQHLERLAPKRKCSTHAFPTKCRVDNIPVLVQGSELHFAPTVDEWRLSLRRYMPSDFKDRSAMHAPRNHPVLLLPGLGSNVHTYDLAPGTPDEQKLSLARHLAALGFDTWVCEVRGNGLSHRARDSPEVIKRLETTEDADAVSEALTHPPYDWDFDNYLQQDVAAMVSYILGVCRPKDERLLAVGHSLGGIMLYAQAGTRGKNAGIAAAVTIASAYDYSRGSVLRLLLPLAAVCKSLNIPYLPIGKLCRLAAPLISGPGEANPLRFVGRYISSLGAMESQLLSDLLSYNFGTVPFPMLHQMVTVFEKSGLTNRSGDLAYADTLQNISVPFLALAADDDKICHPDNVTHTLDRIDPKYAKYICFGQHFGHYDLLVGTKAATEVYPVIENFLLEHD